MMDKQTLRIGMKKLLKAQDKAQITAKSKKIWHKLKDLAEFKKAKVVMFYVSMDGEVDTNFMIDETIKIGKKVVVPFLASKKDEKLSLSVLENREKDLEKGPWGIEQPKAETVSPINKKDIDLVVVPGLAFNEQGYRLGRGKGYYDRFLSELPKSTPSVGLGFDFQITQSLPLCPHDVKLTHLLFS